MGTSKLPRCAAMTRDGSQCGRRVADGSNPPICHVHAGPAQGGAAASAAVPFDGEKLLRKLAHSSNEGVALRATDLLMQLKGASGCATCAARADESARADFIIARATQKQKEELRHHLVRAKELKAIIAKQPVQPVDSDGLPLVALPPPTDYRRAAEPVPAREPASDTSTRPTRPSAVEGAPVPHVVIDPADYDALGILVVNGQLTSTQGDQYLDDLRSGRISITDAKAARKRAVRHFSGARS